MPTTLSSWRLEPSVWLLLAYAIFGCKEEAERADVTVGEDGSVVVEGRRSEDPAFFAADPSYLQKNANFYFKVFGDGFTKRLDDLPMAGEVPDEKKPRSGGYYAEGDGGTNQVVAGNKTPLQKYDQAFHANQSKAATWEDEKHTSGPAWAGHCNGFAATAQRHPKEPSKPVVRNGVTFAPQDVKALMAEIHMNADYEFLGGNRCDTVATPPAPGERADPTVMGVCEDTNPGTFHAAIANWIGRMKHTLIMDQFAGDQVWNYPFYKYQVLEKSTLTATQAKQYVASGGATTYVFNPAAVKFAFLRTEITYANASRTELLATSDPRKMTLQYVLEMDAQGNILGGEWVGADSVRNHPDFIWVALEPLEPNGTRYMGNPHLSNQEVLKMWAESVGEDPDNFTKDIVRPSSPDDWGKWASFEVVLDGNARGAVFAGKPAVVRVKRRDTLAQEEVDLEVLLNGAAIKTAPGGADDVVFPVEPGIGLNRFQFTWRRGGNVVEDQYLRFHVVR